SLFRVSRSLLSPPSFPTRRSSDLVDGQQLRSHRHYGYEPSETPTALALDASPLLASVVASRAPATVDPPTPRVEATRPPFMRVRDRKSTRLNSSHVKISYAVFCLK